MSIEEFYKSKIKTLKEMTEILEQLRKTNPNLVIVTTNGAFDILHSGHLSSLKHAKDLGDILIVCLNSDQSIKMYKSPNRPIIHQDERAKLISALEFVSYVVIFEEPDPCFILSELKPNIHVKSKLGFKGIEKNVVEKNGGKIELIDDINNLSTTGIIDKIIDNYQKNIS